MEPVKPAQDNWTPFEVLNCNLFFFFSGTGEHGVGIGKKEFLVEELGAGTVHLMKTIKQAIDPLGIMNPGKVGPRHRRYCQRGAVTKTNELLAVPRRRCWIPPLRARVCQL